MAESSRLKSILTIGSIAGAIVSILTLVFIFFPRLKPDAITNKAVQITNVAVTPVLDDPTAPPGGCISKVHLDFRIQVQGYEKVALRSYTKLDYARLDDSSPTPSPTGEVPCPPPFGDWRSWRRDDDVIATVGDQSFVLQRTVTVPLKKDNWKIQLKVTDANDRVLATAESASFSSK